jgi:hypothetical protein
VEPFQCGSACSGRAGKSWLYRLAEIDASISGNRERDLIQTGVDFLGRPALRQSPGAACAQARSNALRERLARVA